MAGGAALAIGGSSPMAAEAPVVLELFTSQGCSSCPPADALLGELVRQPNVIGLAWHVDYWNRLGWPDPFARRQWTERQRDYAARLREEVYTPALVVNGSLMVVGSNRGSVLAAMRGAPPLAVTASLRRTGGRLEAEVGLLPSGATMALVVFDPEQVTAVGAGENGGRRLREFQVVRELQRLDAWAERLVLPGIKPTQGAALLVQDQAGRILGAAVAA